MRKRFVIVYKLKAGVALGALNKMAPLGVGRVVAVLDAVVPDVVVPAVVVLDAVVPDAVVPDAVVQALLWRAELIVLVG